MDRLCTVTTLRAPLEETLRFAHYHLHSGVDHVFLFFDDPEDPAADALAGLDGVTAVRCDRAHWEASGLPENPVVEERQVYNATRGLALARERGYDWVAHIDSDELLYAPRGLRETLSRVDAAWPAVRFDALEAVPHRHHHASPFMEVDTFRVPKARRYERLAKALGCRAAFYDGDYFRGYRWGKSATRTTADVEALDLHRPILTGGMAYDSNPVEGLHVLHFDCCGLDAFRAKWRRRLDGTATAVRMRKNRVRQLEAFARRLDDEAQVVRLYERLYFLPRYEQRVLRALGLLTTVSLDARLFERPPAEREAAPRPLHPYRAAS